jgi:hypothetical protein
MTRSEQVTNRVPMLVEPAKVDSELPTTPADPHRALKGLYNSPHLNKVRALTGTGVRPQEIYTPQLIINAVLKVWPHIALDPCTGPGTIIEAQNTCYVKPKHVPVMKKGEAVLDLGGQPKVRTVFRADDGETDGLTARWQDYTYVNPPFAHLKQWMLKCRHEGDDGLEVMLLCPVRSNRKWWRDVEDTSTETCFLDPFAFHGFKSTFPQSMCVMYWGQLQSLFRLAFERLGDCRRKPE